MKKPPPETVSSMDEEDSGRGISYDMASSGSASGATAAAAAAACTGATASPDAASEGNGKGFQEDVRSESSESRRCAHCSHLRIRNHFIVLWFPNSLNNDQHNIFEDLESQAKRKSLLAEL